MLCPVDVFTEVCFSVVKVYLSSVIQWVLTVRYFSRGGLLAGDCGGLSTFRSLRELLSGFVSTNTTQILQARKQMEYDNNKY